MPPMWLVEGSVLTALASVVVLFVDLCWFEWKHRKR